MESIPPFRYQILEDESVRSIGFQRFYAVVSTSNNHPLDNKFLYGDTSINQVEKEFLLLIKQHVKRNTFDFSISIYLEKNYSR